MEQWKHLTAEFERPKQRFQRISDSKLPQLERKASPPVKILPNMTGLRTDEQYDEFMFRNRRETVRLSNLQLIIQ